ncbi:MAG: HPP family protein [Candidatus Cloacimonadota bacterium]|nr:HPP family protein [Candidatus Cloacimonadota bacterium]
MEKSISKIVKEFRRFWKNYVFQSLFAASTIFTALLFLNIEKRPIIIASIGATAFIVFAMPQNITAKPRNAIGGHSVLASYVDLYAL